MSFVTINESHVESDLLVLKSRLESEGIRCFLKNEFTIQIMSGLQVSTTRIERVKEIIQVI